MTGLRSQSISSRKSYRPSVSWTLSANACERSSVYDFALLGPLPSRSTSMGHKAPDFIRAQTGPRRPRRRARFHRRQVDKANFAKSTSVDSCQGGPTRGERHGNLAGGQGMRIRRQRARGNLFMKSKTYSLRQMPYCLRARTPFRAHAAMAAVGYIERYI
jgi:hypothetical protein